MHFLSFCKQFIPRYINYPYKEVIYCYLNKKIVKNSFILHTIFFIRIKYNLRLVDTIQNLIHQKCFLKKDIFFKLYEIISSKNDYQPKVTSSRNLKTLHHSLLSRIRIFRWIFLTLTSFVILTLPMNVHNIRLVVKQYTNYG